MKKNEKKREDYKSLADYLGPEGAVHFPKNPLLGELQSPIKKGEKIPSRGSVPRIPKKMSDRFMEMNKEWERLPLIKCPLCGSDDMGATINVFTDNITIACNSCHVDMRTMG